TTVVPRATCTERARASIQSELAKNRRYWVSPGVVGNSSNTIEELNDIGITESTGTTRKASTAPPTRASVARPRTRRRRRPLHRLAVTMGLSREARSRQTVPERPHVHEVERDRSDEQRVGESEGERPVQHLAHAELDEVGDHHLLRPAQERR